MGKKDKKLGTFIGVGVGPGDPELITIKAINLIKEKRVIAIPGESREKSAAFNIVIAALPEILSDEKEGKKEIIPLLMPMIRDKSALKKQHIENSNKIINYLKEGEDVLFLTLGDPSIYSTFSYLRSIVKDEGYPVKTIPGISSFQSAAAELNISLSDWDEEIRIIPGKNKESIKRDLSFKDNETLILMKPRGISKELKKLVKEEGKKLYGVYNSSREDQALYEGDLIPDEPDYFTVLIAK